ncbi:MAG: alpha-ketoglutarate-dependent dioxygenase AlkB [Mycobacteriaceae bacterium]
MTLIVQPTLFDHEEGPEPLLGELGSTVLRMTLTHGAWVDIRPNWVSSADSLFTTLENTVPWRGEQRRMYDRIVTVPRLVAFYNKYRPLPHPCLNKARDMLSAHYWTELQEPFTTTGLCLYRNGLDSVAWHGDTVGRSKTHDTLVSILSLGSTRTLQLRPRAGGPMLKFTLTHGDLLVMGGSCQRTWEHCVPKSKNVAGPRISIQFRPHNVF